MEDDDDLAAIEDDRDVDGAVHVVDEEPTTAGTGAGLAARFETAALEAFLRAQDRRLAAARAHLLAPRTPTLPAPILLGPVDATSAIVSIPPTRQDARDDEETDAAASHDATLLPEVHARTAPAPSPLAIVEVVDGRLTFASSADDQRSMGATEAVPPAIVRWMTAQAQGPSPTSIVLAALPLVVAQVVGVDGHRHRCRVRWVGRDPSYDRWVATVAVSLALSNVEWPSLEALAGRAVDPEWWRCPHDGYLWLHAACTECTCGYRVPLREAARYAATAASSHSQCYTRYVCPASLERLVCFPSAAATGSTVHLDRFCTSVSTRLLQAEQRLGLAPLAEVPYDVRMLDLYAQVATEGEHGLVHPERWRRMASYPMAVGQLYVALVHVHRAVHDGRDELAVPRGGGFMVHVGERLAARPALKLTIGEETVVWLRTALGDTALAKPKAHAHALAAVRAAVHRADGGGTDAAAEYGGRLQALVDALLAEVVRYEHGTGGRFANLHRSRDGWNGTASLLPDDVARLALACCRWHRDGACRLAAGGPDGEEGACGEYDGGEYDGGEYDSAGSGVSDAESERSDADSVHSEVPPEGVEDSTATTTCTAHCGEGAAFTCGIVLRPSTTDSRGREHMAPRP